MAKFIYKMVIEGAQIVGRAFARALKQEMAASQQAAQRRATSAGANKESATQDLKHGISLEEAIKILNIEKQLNKEDIESKYKHLFEVNDRSKGGSFYLQSKVRNILKSSCSPSFHTLASLQRSSNLVCITSSSQQRLYSTNSDNSNELTVFEKAISDSSLTEAFQRLEKIGANLRSRSNQGNIKGGDSNLRRASVFVPFCRDQDHKPSILVTLRSSNLVTHKWEVSFPGGKESRKDGGDVIETAVRETIEELGIDRNSLKTYGVLKPIIRQKHNSSIYPVLGYLDYDFSRQNLTDFNSSEVEKIILIPLEKACKAEYWNYTHWKSGWVTPIYHDDICNGRQIPRIWGLTASLMSMILKIVLPQHFKGRLPVMKL